MATISGQSVTNNSGPVATGVAIVSTPRLSADNDGTNETYGNGEAIQVRRTFSAAVNVVTTGGTPRPKIKMDPNYGEFWANYASGSGSTDLDLSYTVVPMNVSTAGIAVLANTLQLNGGTIKSASSSNKDAILAHSGLGHNANHKVDRQLTPPTNTATTPAWLPFTGSTRSFSGTPTAASMASLTVTASDAVASVSDTFNIVISAAPPPPSTPGGGSPGSSQPRATQPPPDPSNFARNPVDWSPEGGMQALPTSISEIGASKPSGASGSLDLSTIAASVREEFQSHSRGYYLTTRVFGLDEQPSLVRRATGGSRWLAAGDGERYEVVASSSLLLVKIWQVYYRPDSGHNSIELLGDTFLPRLDNRLTEPVEICLPAPSREAERVRLAVKGRLDPDWTVLETTVEDGMVCADTVQVAWLALVLAPEDEASLLRAAQGCGLVRPHPGSALAGERRARADSPLSASRNSEPAATRNSLFPCPVPVQPSADEFGLR